MFYKIYIILKNDFKYFGMRQGINEQIIMGHHFTNICKVIFSYLNEILPHRTTKY